jgi:CRISPR-associated protein Csm4
MELRRYRLRLDPLSPFGTPPTSGTIFGHLCWAKRRREGREALRSWLARLPAEPFLISDLLPAEHLPRPLPPPSQQESPAEDAKTLKRRRYLPREEWQHLRVGLSATTLQDALRKTKEDPPFLRPASRPHNRIDRTSGHTPEAGGGGLWFAEELWPSTDRKGRRQIEADLYVHSVLPPREVEMLIADIGATGFGRDASLGRGRFTLEGSEAAGWLMEAPAAGGTLRMLSLSQGVISSNMREARWQRFVLFGKVGKEMLAEGFRPWKLPLVLAEAGATFCPADDGPYGAWITGLHQDEDPTDPIGHNAFHLAIPYTEAAA